jgi:hypothetical protein
MKLIFNIIAAIAFLGVGYYIAYKDGGVPPFLTPEKVLNDTSYKIVERQIIDSLVAMGYPRNSIKIEDGHFVITDTCHIRGVISDSITKTIGSIKDSAFAMCSDSFRHARRSIDTVPKKKVERKISKVPLYGLRAHPYFMPYPFSGHGFFTSFSFIKTQHWSLDSSMAKGGYEVKYHGKIVAIGRTPTRWLVFDQRALDTIRMSLDSIKAKILAEEWDKL